MEENIATILDSGLKRLYDIEVKKASEESLLEFTAYMWPIIDPGNEFVPGYAIEAICDHLQAVHTGHIRNLLITVPPGCTKSTISSVMFPAWSWGPKNQPWKRYINASYTESLSLRDNLRSRRIITSDRYQALWPITLTQPATAMRFENEATGWKLATSVGGSLTGHRGDCIILDDPNNPKDVESDAVRKTTNIWFTEVVPTRLNNMEKSAIIIIQQRVHMEDVAGIALSKDMVDVHLNLQMEYEPRAYVNAYTPDGSEIVTLLEDDARNVDENDVFWRDWRSEPGELLWPERFSWKVVDRLKKSLGPTAASAQLQQMPVPRGGTIIKASYWQTWKDESYPPLDFILASVDTAFTEDERNDPSACTVWGVSKDEFGNPRVILMFAWDDYLTLSDLVEKLSITCSVDDRRGLGLRFPVDRLLIENKASGISAAQELARLVGMSGAFGVELFVPRGDKESRLRSIEHVFATGIIHAPNKDWADKVIDQVSAFGFTGHDDYVDSTSMAISWLRGCGFTPTREEISADLEEELRFRPKTRPLYPV